MRRKDLLLTGQGLRVITLIAFGLVYIAAVASPAMAQGFSVGSGRDEYLVSPGESFSGAITVTNTSEEPVALRVFIGDWVRVPGQTSTYGFSDEGGIEPRSLVPWMVFSPERVTLEPEEKRDIMYEGSVPDDPSLEGSYWAMIFIEGIPPEEPDVVPTPEGEIGVGIKTIFRYGIQVYATIEGTERREATFTSLNIDQAEGGFNAVAIFENKGNIYLRPKVWIELRDAAGEVVYTQEHKERIVLPESARDFTFELKGLPIESGEYLLMILADYGAPKLIAAQGRVNLTITPPPPPEEGAASGEGESETSGEGESGATGEGESGASGEGAPSG